jgi:hypothetical protein
MLHQLKRSLTLLPIIALQVTTDWLQQYPMHIQEAEMCPATPATAQQFIASTKLNSSRTPQALHKPLHNGCHGSPQGLSLGSFQLEASNNAHLVAASPQAVCRYSATYMSSSLSDHISAP